MFVFADRSDTLNKIVYLPGSPRCAMILKDGRMLAVGCEKGWTCIFSLEKPVDP